MSNSEFAFDATTIDPNTVFLAGAPVRPFGNDPDRILFQDVNQDGLMDAVVHIEVNQLNLLPTDTIAVLIGKTFPQSVQGDPQAPGRISFTGQDFVNIVPDQSPPGQNSSDESSAVVVPLPTAPPTSVVTEEAVAPTQEATPAPITADEVTAVMPTDDATDKSAEATADQPSG